MLRRAGTLAAALLALAAFAPVAHGAEAPAAAAGDAALVLAPGSRLWLEGDSTLHKYKAEASGLRLVTTVAPEATAKSLADVATAGQLQALQLTVPAKKLTSGDGGLDKNMWKALNADAHPDIVFKLDSYKAQPGADGQSLDVRVLGRLTVAGTEKPVEVGVRAFRSGNGLRLIGNKELLMSDFSVTAPVLMGGMIKTDNKVVIRFDLKLQPRTP
jgi:polyisoprenoid-binding protein YceI